MADDDENDPTAPFNELQAFDSIWEALRWKQIKHRIPTCIQKTLYNRYFLANLVYLLYAIGILIVDFNPNIYGVYYDYDYDSPQYDPLSDLNGTDGNDTCPEVGYDTVNIMFISLGCVHLISATLYWWSWADHRWNDVIMIPEYLNHIEAGLYLWSALWYPHENCDYFGYYTLTIHKIETVAAFVELFASFGWIMSWYRTYTRTIGRGYTLDDPDTVAYTLTTLSSFIYITYNIQILIDPEQYESNTIYTNGDIVYFVGAVFYLLANLRDDGWLWWTAVSGQYGIAAGKVQTGKSVQVGLPHLLIGGSEPLTSLYRQCFGNKRPTTRNAIEPVHDQTNANNNDNDDRDRV